MKLIILCLIVLIVSVGLGILALEDPGYIVMFRDPYEIRMPLLVLVLIVFLAFIIFYLALNFIVKIIRAPREIGRLKRKMDEDAAYKACMQGFTGLIEGRWDQAEDRLVQRVGSSRIPLMNYLGAAYAALQQGSFRRRDMYLDQALESQPKHRLSIQLTRARFHCLAGEYAEARKVLEDQQIQNPKNKTLLHLLMDVYQALEDWQAMKGILPMIKKMKVLPADEIAQREQLTWGRLLGADEPDVDLLEGPSNWKTLTAKQRRNPAILSAWVKSLLAQGETKEAETILRRALNKQYSSRLVDLYGQVHSPFIPYQIELVQKLLKTRPESPELFLAIARLYRYAEDFNVSLSWYEKVMALGASDGIFAEMASVHEQMGNSETALDLYKKGLAVLEDRSERTDGSGLVTNHLLVHDLKIEMKSDHGSLPVVR